jgi:hypothetical protein
VDSWVSQRQLGCSGMVQSDDRWLWASDDDDDDGGGGGGSNGEKSDRNAKIPETKQVLHLKDWLTRDVTNMAAVSKGGNTTKFAS